MHHFLQFCLLLGILFPTYLIASVGGQDCGIKPGWQRMHKNSKYLFQNISGANVPFRTLREAKNFCTENKFEPISISSRVDWKSIQAFYRDLFRRKYCETCRTVTEITLDASTNRLVDKKSGHDPFLIFAFDEPNGPNTDQEALLDVAYDVIEGRDRVFLVASDWGIEISQHWVPACQLRTNSDCFKASVEETSRERKKITLKTYYEDIGASLSYYWAITNRPTSYKEAKELCQGASPVGITDERYGWALIHQDTLEVELKKDNENLDVYDMLFDYFDHNEYYTKSPWWIGEHHQKLHELHNKGSPQSYFSLTKHISPFSIRGTAFGLCVHKIPKHC